MNSAHLRNGTNNVRPRAKGKQAAEKSGSFPKVLKVIAHVTHTTRFPGDILGVSLYRQGSGRNCPRVKSQRNKSLNLGVSAQLPEEQVDINKELAGSWGGQWFSVMDTET